MRTPAQCSADLALSEAVQAMDAAIERARDERDDKRSSTYERLIARTMVHELVELRVRLIDPLLADLGAKEAEAEAAREREEAESEADWERRFPAANDRVVTA